MFATLSVEENLRLSFRRSKGRAGVPAALEAAFAQFPALGRRRGQLAGTLSGGEQRMLSLARVLVEAPKLLVADELSLGLAPIVVDEIYRELARLRSEGTALLIVEQQVTHALDLCDRAVLLDRGAVTWEGPAAEAHQRVAEGFLPAPAPPPRIAASAARLGGQGGVAAHAHEAGDAARVAGEVAGHRRGVGAAVRCGRGGTPRRRRCRRWPGR